MTTWLRKRLTERTTLDGAVLVGVGVVVLIFSPFAKFAAYGAVGYGVWTMWKKQ